MTQTEIVATKPVNVSQLGVELGRVALHAVGPDEDGQTIIRADVPRSALESALAAHAADDDWADPEYVPPPDPDTEFRATLTAATTVTQLRDALLGKAGPGAQARRPDSR